MKKIFITDYIKTPDLEKKIFQNEAEVICLNEADENKFPKEIGQADGLLVWHAKISDVTLKKLKKKIAIMRYGVGYDNIDLKGATVIPGFIDAHFHLKNYGKRLKQLNLKGIANFDDIIDMVKQALLDIQPDEWLIGFGWDQNLWAHRQFPNEEHLNNLNSTL